MQLTPLWACGYTGNFYSILFALFYSFLFCSVPFYSTLFCLIPSVLLCSFLLSYLNSLPVIEPDPTPVTRLQSRWAHQEGPFSPCCCLKEWCLWCQLLTICCMTNFKYLFNMQMIPPRDSLGRTADVFPSKRHSPAAFPLCYWHCVTSVQSSDKPNLIANASSYDIKYLFDN
jgi:hypothetical protein